MNIFSGRNKKILQATALSAIVGLGYGIASKINKVQDDVYATVAHERLPSLQNYPVYYTHEGLPEDRIEDTVDCLVDSYEIISQNGKIQDPRIIAEYFPLLVKESLLLQKDEKGNILKSRTGAMGIAQMKGPAIEDAKKFLQDELGVDAKDYNPEKMQDNCALGMAYFVKNKEILKGKIPSGITFDDEFYYAAYNGGATRLAEMMIEFQKAKKANHITWKEFATWLSAKANGVNGNKSNMEFSKAYNVEYNNYFPVNLMGNEEKLTFGSKIETTKAKIQEIINYVEIIDGIRFTDQSARQGEVVTRGRSLLYESHRDEFHGDGIIDELGYNFRKKIGVNSRYRQAMAVPGKGAFSILSSANIYPSQENLQKFYDLNNLDKDELFAKDDVIKKDRYYLIPNVDIEFSSQEGAEQDVENEVNAPESKPQESSPVTTKMTPPNVKKYLESVEVKNNSLKGKVFILDPGHGGIDVGAVRPSVDSKGNHIAYTGNDIVLKNGESIKAKNGQGDKLFTIEATLVMDVSLRLATLIRQNGGTVHFTHASTDKITKDIGASKNKNNPAQLDQLDNDYVQGVPGTKFDVSGGKKQRRMNRQNIRDELLPNNQNNTFLLSLHIDSIDNKKDVPLRYLYNTTSQQRFAESMMRNSDEEVVVGNSGYLYILRDNQDVKGEELPKNAALIELGNIQNREFDQRIRSADGRQAYAESIFKALKTTATS